MSWYQSTMVAFDLETTGKNPEEARIVTATILTVEPGEKPHAINVLADPGIEIPAEATAVHGNTTEYAREHGRPAGEVALELAATLADHVGNGTPVVIYNASYDLTVLDRECRRHDVPTLHAHCEEDSLLDLYVVDPLVLDRAVDRFRKGKRRLVDVCAHYGIPLTEEDAHTSEGDCLATARLAWKIAHVYPEIAALSLAELQAYQATAHRAWAASYEKHLRGKGKDDVIGRDWPIRLAVSV